MGSREGELRAKLRAFHERKQLPVLEAALAGIEGELAGASTGQSLIADEVPAEVIEAIRSLWNIDWEPVDFIPDDTEESALAVWMEEQLAENGIGRNCYVATGLSIKPWIGCTQTPGWTRTLRTVLPDPLILAEDFSAVVGFLEEEYYYTVYAATIATS